VGSHCFVQAGFETRSGTALLCICSATQVKLAKDALNESASKVLAMKDHIEEIAELLNEMVDPEVQGNTACLAAIMRGVHVQSQAAFAIAFSDKEKLQAVTTELQQIGEEYKTKQQTPENQAKIEKHQKESDTKFCETFWNLASSAIAGGMGTQFGPAAASTVLGSSAAGGGAVAPLAGVGFCGAVCATYAFKTVWAASEFFQQRKEVKESTEAAKKEAGESRAMVQKAEQCEAVVNAQVAKANAHGDMWRAVSKAAESAAQIDLTAVCGQKFKEKMKAFATGLKIFAEAGVW